MAASKKKSEGSSKKEPASKKRKTSTDTKGEKAPSSPRKRKRSTNAKSSDASPSKPKPKSTSPGKSSTKKSRRSSSASKSGRGKKSPSTSSPSIRHEFKKGFIAIFLLLCIVGMVAMGIDIYLTRLPEISDQTTSGPENRTKQDQQESTHYFSTTDTPQPHLKKKSSRKKLSKHAGMTHHPFPIFEVFDDAPAHPPTPAVPDKPKPSTPSSTSQNIKPTQTKKSAESNPDGPQIAIIIDDIGFDTKTASRLANLDLNITMSILPAAPFAVKTARVLHSKGAELMLHLPMEPAEYPEVDPGPGAILSSMTPDELLNTLRKNLDSVPYITGVNNHMGSAITPLSPQMHQIFTLLKRRNLFFIDSYTTKHSRCSEAAHLFQLPFARRDVFLDNIQDVSYIRKQLKKLVKRAERHRTAIGIGHPYPATVLALEQEAAALKKSAKLVPASTLVAVPQS